MRLVADVNRNGVLDAAEKRPGQPKIINYEATYPAGAPWAAEGKAGLPILNMMQCASATACDDRALRDQRRDRRPERRRHVPGQHLPAGKRRQAQPDGAQPPRAVPRFRVGVPRRNRRRPRPSPASTRPTRCSATCWRASRTRFMINYGSGGIGSRDHRQPARRRPDARLPELRLRRVLPDLVHGRRPGADGGRAGQPGPGNDCCPAPRRHPARRARRPTT